MGAVSARARLVFCAASAITAAAIADPVMESLSNAGRFGAGRFTDQSNADVAPALAAGLLFAALFVAALTRRMLPAARSNWLRRSAGALPPPAALRLFPPAFALQLTVLFAMETVEQIVVTGHPLGGTIWLGGPVAVALAFHALAGIVVATAFAYVLRLLASRVADVITYVRRLSVTWPGTHHVAFVAARGASPRRTVEPALDRLRGRAPPTPAFLN